MNPTATPIPFGALSRSTATQNEEGPKSATEIFGRPKKRNRGTTRPYPVSLPELVQDQVKALLEKCRASAYTFETIGVEHFLTFTFSDRLGAQRTIRLVWMRHEKQGGFSPTTHDLWVPSASAPGGYALEICADAFSDVQATFMNYLSYNRFPPLPSRSP